MKITALPEPVADPHAQIVESVLAMPVNAFVVAHGDLYQVGSHTSTDLLLRTGDTGFVSMPHRKGATGLNHRHDYHGKGDAGKWVRHYLALGATISIVDPNAEA